MWCYQFKLDSIIHLINPNGSSVNSKWKDFYLEMFLIMYNEILKFGVCKSEAPAGKNNVVDVY